MWWGKKMNEWVTEKIDKNQRIRKKERGRGKKESHKNKIYIYILTTQHFQRELRKYLPVENRFCTMFEEALRRLKPWEKVSELSGSREEKLLLEMITEDSLLSPFPFVCVVFLPSCISLSAHSWSLLCAPGSQASPPHWLTDWRQDKKESCPAYRKSRGQVHSFGRRCSCSKSPQNQQMQSHRGSLIARLISSLSSPILCVQNRKKARKQPASPDYTDATFAAGSTKLSTLPLRSLQEETPEIDQKPPQHRRKRSPVIDPSGIEQDSSLLQQRIPQRLSKKR